MPESDSLASRVVGMDTVNKVRSPTTFLIQAHYLTQSILPSCQDQLERNFPTSNRVCAMVARSPPRAIPAGDP